MTVEDVVKSVELLRLEPGDKIILTTPHTLSDAAISRLREQWERMFPSTRAVILEHGLQLHVLRGEP